MTPTGMAALRMAATLVHTLPGVRIRLRAGQHTVLDVTPEPDAEGSAIRPCAFRMAVARAHERLKAGVRLRFRGLPEGVEPVVDVLLRAGDSVRPGGIYRINVGAGVVHAFATTLPPRRCRQLLEGIGSRSQVRLHHDAATEVTLVFAVVSGAEDGGDDEAHHVGIEEALVAFGADEVLYELAGIGL